ncbi:NRG-like protein [Mya arenaria]|uniref:NRG-like protein n=1 Tax=Mya arenaria TaxID=6604 RepID=A0ABY7FTE2_MYAAR|nr:NRG-like protein [Mya arenaria]
MAISMAPLVRDFVTCEDLASLFFRDSQLCKTFHTVIQHVSQSNNMFALSGLHYGSESATKYGKASREEYLVQAWRVGGNSLYRWKRNNIDFNPSGNDDRVVQLPNQGTIVFNAPEDKDEGIFQCFADNGYGVAASVRVNFREAKLARFPYEERKVTYAEAGQAVTLQCTPPQSFPPADVYWVIKERDNRWQAINFDKRISMDIEGRLRFTNVKKSDEQGGRAYSCMALNYFMRDNAIGPEFEIRVTGTTEQKHAATELWTSPSDQFFKAGSTLKLKCIFSGNPTPDVYWERINGILPDRAAIKSFGQELHITDVHLSDAGQYECMGLNTESQQRATKAFDVHVEYSAQGVEGTRDPRIHNNPRFFKPTQYNITLIGLTLEDHMNIQCNASNKQGYVYSNVYLNVLEEAPTILVPPPPSIKVAEAQSIILTCEVAGKPDPLIEWYRDTSLITGGRM